MDFTFLLQEPFCAAILQAVAPTDLSLHAPCHVLPRTYPGQDAVCPMAAFTDRNSPCARGALLWGVGTARRGKETQHGTASWQEGLREFHPTAGYAVGCVESQASLGARLKWPLCLEGHCGYRPCAHEAAWPGFAGQVEAGVGGGVCQLAMQRSQPCARLLSAVCAVPWAQRPCLVPKKEPYQCCRWERPLRAGDAGTAFGAVRLWLQKTRHRGGERPVSNSLLVPAWDQQASTECTSVPSTHALNRCLWGTR